MKFLLAIFVAQALFVSAFGTQVNGFRPIIMEEVPHAVEEAPVDVNEYQPESNVTTFVIESVFSEYTK